MICCECRWWKPREELDCYCEIDEGDCHRYPPIVPCVSRVTELGIAVLEEIRGAVLTTYPTTYATEFCGEFERKAVERTERGMTVTDRKPVEFDVCPDCGLWNYPSLERKVHEGDDLVVLSLVRAECPNCGWMTLYYRSVKECAAEWNSAKI